MNTESNKTTGELLRELVSSHVAKDECRFREYANRLVDEERRKNHHVLASDLERLLVNGSRDAHTQVGTLKPFRRYTDEVPLDSERGLPLLQVIEPQRTPQSLVLAGDLETRLDRIELELRRAALLGSFGLRPASRLLFYGPPGCGKTATAESLALRLDLPLYLVRFDAVVSSYLGETAANLGRVFDWAATRPAVLMFDEFDAIGRRRDDEQEHGELKRVVNSFLQMLDSFRFDGVVVAATNHEGLLDRAVWRRFDEVLYFALPDEAQLQHYLRAFLRLVPVAQRFPYASIAAKMCGFTYADAERACSCAIKEMLIMEQPKLSAAALMRESAIQRSRVDRTRGS